MEKFHRNEQGNYELQSILKLPRNSAVAISTPLSAFIRIREKDRRSRTQR